MNTRTVFACLLAASLLLAAPAAPAQDHPSAEHPAPEHPAAERGHPGPGVLGLLPADSVTTHSIALAGRTLAYTATAGTLPLYDEHAERIALVYYTAYVAKGADPATRPVTFAFNGGPGAGSAYLHLGLVGPRIVDFGPDGGGATAPKLRDNAETWLDFSDLVLIDPIGTGWSRTANPDDGKKFWGVRQDAQAMAKVVALYIARNGRAAAPKYLLGESYGGMRAPKVAQALRADQGVMVSGLVLLSPLLDGGFSWDYALGAALELPSLAAAEMERTHSYDAGKLPEIEHFALTDFLTTLAAAPPDDPAKSPVFARVAALTGLPPDLVARNRGFLRNLYVKHSDDPAHELVSRYDAAFAVGDPFFDYDGARGSDPILDGYTRAFGGAFVGYARDELGFKTDITYELLSPQVGHNWDWNQHGPWDAVSVAGDLRELLAYEPGLRVLVAHGTSDIQTPYAISRYVLDHLQKLGAPDRVQLKLYSGGHMVYLREASRLAFSADARAFYAE
ncbi:MAG: alpha/beta hydrolase fold domain-containing protein [Acidisphaera sp.]|nr:alpha/beta hydrolase fold domain-containing protein [Acidisphaera sp.]